MTKKILLGCVILGLVSVLLYVFWLRGLVVQSFYGTAPSWFMVLVNGLYPRFVVEKHRFELSFFLRHTDQMVIRFGLIQMMVISFVVLKSRYSAFRLYWHRFWNLQETSVKIRWYGWAVYSCVLFFTYDWFWVLAHLHQARDFYKPLLFLRAFFLPFPSVWISGILCSVLVISCLAVVFRFQQIFFSVWAALLFTVMQAWIFSFEKVDHAFAPLTYVLWLMPFLFYQVRHHQPQWALSLIRLVIGIVYLQAGLEKLLTGGVEWLAPDTFRNYLYLHPTHIGLWVARYDWLCGLLPLLALGFQLSFITCVFFRNLRWVLLPMGILFHTGTFVLMGVGGVVNAWVWLYVLYL